MHFQFFFHSIRERETYPCFCWAAVSPTFQTFLPWFLGTFSIFSLFLCFSGIELFIRKSSFLCLRRLPPLLCSWAHTLCKGSIVQVLAASSGVFLFSVMSTTFWPNLTMWGKIACLEVLDKFPKSYLVLRIRSVQQQVLESGPVNISLQTTAERKLEQECRSCATFHSHLGSEV